MNVETVGRPIAAVVAECLAVGIFEDAADAPEALRGLPVGELVARLLAAKELGGAVGDTTMLYEPKGLAAGSLLIFGLGSRAAFGAGPAYAAGVAVSRKLSAKKREVVAVAIPDDGELEAVTSALTEGLIVGTRGPGLRKTEPARHAFESLLIVKPADPFPAEVVASAVRRGEIVGESVNLARDLANTPPAEKSPEALAARAREAAVAAGVGVEVWNVDRIRQERFGGLLGVAAGSDAPPSFVVLDYHRGGDAPAFALVGKGITFDSGGLSLKPTASMEDMKSDMTGAAVVLATLCAVARLGLPVNVRGYLAISENMTGGRALKLGDVLTMRNGKTVEVLNTDAEGRLVLADALSYAVESQPARLLDLATLTGACLVALGTRIAGLFATDDAFATEVAQASLRTGERTWRLPLDDDFLEGLKSQVADLKNVAGKWGGAVTAAKFLQQFVGVVPWVHLDIAGPSWADTESATRDTGGTGCYVRTLVNLIEAGSARDPG